MTAIWKIWSKLLRAFTPPFPPHTLGTNKPFWGRDRLKNLTEHICNGTRHQQSERNLSIYRDSPTCSPNLTNFGIQTAENGWRVLVNPLHFCIRRTKSLAGSRWALLRFLLVTKINYFLVNTTLDLGTNYTSCSVPGTLLRPTASSQWVAQLH